MGIHRIVRNPLTAHETICRVIFMHMKKNMICKKKLAPVIVECIDADNEEEYEFPTLKQAEGCFNSISAGYKQVCIKQKDGDVLLMSENTQNGRYEKFTDTEKIKKRLIAEGNKEAL